MKPTRTCRAHLSRAARCVRCGHRSIFSACAAVGRKSESKGLLSRLIARGETKGLGVEDAARAAKAKAALSAVYALTA